MNILISGGTGLVGSALVKALRQNNHEVRVLVRTKNSQKSDEFFWDYKNGQIDPKAFENIDTIIHLAGATIAKRWTKEYKKEIISSRVDSARFLKNYCKKNHIRLQSFISASGINYYGTFTSHETFSEDTGKLNDDFLSNVCKVWEQAANEYTEISERLVIVRTAPVLSKKGGTFQPLEKITDFHLASGVGSGKQWFNWIHLDDLVQMYVDAVEDKCYQGIYNAVATEIPTQKDFMKDLAKKKNKFFFPINVPAIFLKLALGEMSEIILKGTRISNKKVIENGFDFKFPTVSKALEHLTQK